MGTLSHQNATQGLALVFAGGALGSLARYGLMAVVLPFWAVWAVNVAGSFALGLLLGSAPGRRLRLLLGTGFLGGFTTYSAFALDIVQLAAVGGPVFGLAAGALQVAMGVVAALLGFALAEGRRPRDAT